MSGLAAAIKLGRLPCEQSAQRVKFENMIDVKIFNVTVLMTNCCLLTDRNIRRADRLCQVLQQP